MRCLAFRRDDRIETALEAINSLADGLENGRSLMGFHAPILIEDIAVGPTANTISSAAGGPAATLWSQEQSSIQRRQRSAQRRSLAMFIAGIAVGTIATGSIVLAMRRADQAAEDPHIALNERETEHAASASTPPSDAALAASIMRAAPGSTSPSDAALAPASTSPSDAALASSAASPVTRATLAGDTAREDAPMRVAGGDASRDIAPASDVVSKSAGSWRPLATLATGVATTAASSNGTA